MRDRLRNLRHIREDMRHMKRWYERMEEEYEELTAWIDGIEDSFVRSIMRMRYFEGLEWSQIAHRIGGNTPDSVRMTHNRFLKIGELCE